MSLRLSDALRICCIVIATQLRRLKEILYTEEIVLPKKNKIDFCKKFLIDRIDRMVKLRLDRNFIKFFSVYVNAMLLLLLQIFANMIRLCCLFEICICEKCVSAIKSSND